MSPAGVSASTPSGSAARWITQGGRARPVAPVVARLAWATLFFWCYVCSYVSFLPEAYDGWGLGQHIEVLSSTTCVLWLLALVPALFIRPSLKHTSDFFIYIQYFLIYVPALWVAFNATHPDVDRANAVAIDATLFLSMMILVVASHLRKRRPAGPPRHPSAGVGVLAVVSVLMFMFIGSALGWHFNLVGFDEIYALRADASDALAASGGAGVVGYLFTWLNGALLPVLFCVGLYRRDWKLLALGTALYIGLYALWGSKASLLAPAAFLVVNWLVKRFEGRHFAAFSAFFSVLLVLPYAFRLLDPDVGALTTRWYAYVVHQRTFNSSALLIPQYLEFFDNNPLTYGSHVTGINALVHYPFELDVARMVGLYQYNAPMTANVNFWAQDGVAAFGLIGIPVISVIAALIFFGIDYRLRRLPLAFCIASMTFMASNMIDTSIFTTLVSGGLLLIVIVLPLMFRQAAPRRAVSDIPVR